MARDPQPTPGAMPDDEFAALLDAVAEGGRILRAEQAPARAYDVAAVIDAGRRRLLRETSDGA